MSGSSMAGVGQQRIGAQSALTGQPALNENATCDSAGSTPAGGSLVVSSARSASA